MSESITTFGPSDSLHGILSLPDAAGEVASSPVAIILNAGIVHHIGPFRLHVQVANALSRQGFRSLRFDLSGLGDSLPRLGKLAASERAVLDVQDAMDHLERTLGATSFVLIGLCSGAFNAHQVAKADARVVGAVFLDGIVFRTRSYFWKHDVGRLFRPRFWRNAIKRRLLENAEAPGETEGSALAEAEFFSNELCREEVAQEIRDFHDRGMRMLFVYTEGYDDICDAAQFEEMYGLRPDGNQVEIEYYHRADHTFRIEQNREVVCERISDWYRKQFESSLAMADI